VGVVVLDVSISESGTAVFLSGGNDGAPLGVIFAAVFF
jgi:hypothetical protein